MALPLIAAKDDRRVVGIVRRSDITQAYLQKLHGPATATGGPDGAVDSAKATGEGI